MSAVHRQDTRPRGYVGRHRADEDGNRVTACLDPAGHDRLERDPAQEWRLPARVPPGHCGWCGGAR